MPKSKFRDDITVIGVPLTAISNREYTDPRQRQLFKNIIYLGALSALLDIDVAEIEKLIGEQFKGKEKLFDANTARAAPRPRLGDCMNLDHPIGLRLKRADSGRRPHLHRRKFGGGARRRLWRRNGVRLVSDHAVVLARRGFHPPLRPASRRRRDQEEQIRHRAGGRRARFDRHRDRRRLERRPRLHRDLGPGHFADAGISRACLFRRNSRRHLRRAARRPSTGMPTRTQQIDIISCAYASHGDTKHVLLFPEDPAETFEFGAAAFDLADRLQTPVFVMLDLDIGMNHRLCAPLALGRRAQIRPRQGDDGGRRSIAGRDFGRYLDVDGDGIPFRTYPGTHPTKGSFFTRGTSRDRYARYTEEGPAYRRQHAAAACASSRPRRTWCRARCRPTPTSRPNTASSISARPRRRWTRRSDAGSTTATSSTGCASAPSRSIPACRASSPSTTSCSSSSRTATAQLRSLIVNECGIDPVRLVPILHYDGTPITARFIARAIGEHLDALKVTPLRKVVS